MESGNDVRFVVFITVFFSLVRGCWSADICNVGGDTKLCDYGCCDDDCCDDFDTAQIIGVVIGGIMALVFLVSCIACIVMLYKKKKRRAHTGEVRPYGQNTNSVFIHNGPSGYGQGYGNGPYGQQYGQQYGHPPPRGAANPPSYTQASGYPHSRDQDPAYPPGTVDHHPPPYTFSDNK